MNKINGSIKESNKNKYLVLVLTDENKNLLKNMKNYGIRPKLLSEILWLEINGKRTVKENTRTL